MVVRCNFLVELGFLLVGWAGFEDMRPELALCDLFMAVLVVLGRRE